MYFSYLQIKYLLNQSVSIGDTLKVGYSWHLRLTNAFSLAGHLIMINTYNLFVNVNFAHGYVECAVFLKTLHLL